MTGLTRECWQCGGHGLGRCRCCSDEGCSTCMVSDHPDDFDPCERCDGSGRIPVLERELEKGPHKQMRLPTL